MGGPITWRGSRFDQRTIAMMEAAEQVCGISISPTQGSYNTSVGASAGTHSGCGAVDVSVRNMSRNQIDQLVAALRSVGFAAWHRAAGFSIPHVHAIAVQPGGKHDRGCLSASAHDQIIDYYDGRNGLADNGRDDGPRNHVGVTWETYQGGDDMTPDQAHSLAECRRMLAVLLAAQSPAPGEHGIATQTRADEISENAREARRLGAVLLDASPPVGNERTIPAQLNG